MTSASGLAIVGRMWRGSAETALWVVTTYFNPAGYAARRHNHQRFCAALGAVPCLTIECAERDRTFELAPGPNVVQVRAADTLWHKERLINLALCRLPPSCRFVAWVDGDVLFENPDWQKHAMELLGDKCAVQLFSDVALMPSPLAAQHDEKPQVVDGFAAKTSRDPESLRAGRFDAHGHSGFAWAMRRDVLSEVGLYDACIVGSADHVMAHALLDGPFATCVTRLLGLGTPHHRHFVAWADRLRASIGQRRLAGIGAVPGRILHLWHGSIADRRYFDRNQRLLRLGFDPRVDLLDEPGQPWRLRDPGGELAAFLRDYFAQRNEDSL